MHVTSTRLIALLLRIYCIHVHVLILTVDAHKSDDVLVQDAVGASTAAPASGSNTVNKAISQLAQRYCGDCRNSFDELSKIIQKVSDVPYLLHMCVDTYVLR